MPVAQFSGLASGIDSGALIDAVIEAREIRNDLRRTEIEHLEGENDALEELNTKFLALNDLIDKFRTTNNGGVSKKATSSDPTVATALIGSNAINASYTLSVTSIADTATGSFNNAYSSATSHVSASGSGDVTVTVGTGADQVVITAAVTANTTTLTDLANTINSDSNASGRVVASVVNIGTDGAPDYRLMLTTLEQGLDKGSLSLSADAAITELSGATTIDQATNAVFSVNGISTSITRDSNSVNNIISGITFNLQDTGTTSITVGNDTDSTAGELQEIIDAFNEIVEYVNENDTVERVESGEDNATNIFGSLAKTRTDNDFLSQFRTALLSATASTGTAVTAVSELGISTNRDGTLSFKEDAFVDAVNEDPQGATEVLRNFADQTAGVQGFIYQYTKLNGFVDSAQDSNNTEIENLNNAIAQLERQTAKIRESMEKQFANLEKITSEMQSQQSALSGILAGLG